MQDPLQADVAACKQNKMWNSQNWCVWFLAQTSLNCELSAMCCWCVTRSHLCPWIPTFGWKIIWPNSLEYLFWEQEKLVVDFRLAWLEGNRPSSHEPTLDHLAQLHGHSEKFSCVWGSHCMKISQLHGFKPAWPLNPAEASCTVPSCVETAQKQTKNNNSGISVHSQDRLDFGVVYIIIREYSPAHSAADEQ